MKIKLLIVLLGLVTNGYCQDVTSKALLRQIMSHREWQSSNDDSSYYKSDTVTITDKDHIYQQKYCNEVNWKFINKRVFKLSYYECSGCGTSIVPVPDKRRFKLSSRDGFITARICSEIELEDIFIVCSITETKGPDNQVGYSIKLARQK